MMTDCIANVFRYELYRIDTGVPNCLLDHNGGPTTLKLTNDLFGHQEDNLIIETAICLNCAVPTVIAARTGTTNSRFCFLGR
jgi:hypothetical protein